MTYSSVPHGSTSDSDTITHRDGVEWYKAKAPFPIHKCRVQSDGWIGLTSLQRCACGAKRVNYGRWFDKNERLGSPKKVLKRIFGAS